MIIYKTTNLINGKIYIGQNSTDNSKYLGSGLLLTHSIKKYGVENFIKEILEICSDKDELNEREKYWIIFYNSRDTNIGYNLSEGGTGGKLVDVEGKKGKTYEEYYGEEKAKHIKELLSKSGKGVKNIYKNITSEEVGKKISEALSGREITENHKEKISNTLKEYFKTYEGIKNRKKLSDIKKGVNLSDEHKLKIKNSMKGKIPKKLDVHPSARYWYFYDNNNNLILEILGGRTKALKELKTNQKRIKIFDNLDECLSYKMEKNMDYKLYYKKYYKI